LQKTRAEETEQIAVPRGVPWISGKRQPPSDTYALYIYTYIIIEGSLEIKLPTIWTDEKQSREEAERRERLEERRSEEKEAEERRCRCAKR
jgi:hypothetical protein